MIPVGKPRKPRTFDRDCGVPGNQWLAANPRSKAFPAHWTKFHRRLEKAFSHRCGWWAVRITDGAVDHYLSKKNYRSKTYDWENYRYIAGSVNSSKRNQDDAVLDPFEIQAGWFEVILPSMQLVTTAQIPVHLKAKADFTIKKLKLANGYKIRALRRKYYEDFKANKLTRVGLADYAPLVADAVQRWQHTGKPLP
jgi:hypothetical protein